MNAFVQYFDAHFNLKTKDVSFVLGAEGYIYTVLGIDTSFFPVALYSDGERLTGLTLLSASNNDVVGFMNDTSSNDTSCIPLSAFYNSHDVVVFQHNKLPVVASVVAPTLFYGKVRPLIVVRSAYYDEQFLNSFYPNCGSDPLRKMLTVYFNSVAGVFERRMSIAGVPFYYDVPYLEPDIVAPPSPGKLFKLDDIMVYISSLDSVRDHSFTIEAFPTFNFVVIRVNENNLITTRFGYGNTLTENYEFATLGGVPTIGLGVDWKAFPYFVE